MRLGVIGHRKSAIAQNVIQNVLDSSDFGVVFVSLEMPGLQAWSRQLQIALGLTSEQITYAYRTEPESPGAQFVKRYGDRLLIIDDSRLDISGIRAFTAGAVASRTVVPVGLLVIDYLGLLDHGGRASLTDRVSELAREMKRLAKQLNVVVLMIVQTNRSAGDESQEVSVVEARDSGAIEDSADFLLGAWRPELAKEIGIEAYADVAGQMHFSILKNRRGPKDNFVMGFNGETLRVGPIHGTGLAVVGGRDS